MSVPFSPADRISGGLISMAIGDALGVPVEFLPREIPDAQPVTGITGYETLRLRFSLLDFNSARKARFPSENFHSYSIPSKPIPANGRLLFLPNQLSFRYPLYSFRVSGSFLPVFRRSYSVSFFEYSGKIRRVVKSGYIGDFTDIVIRVSK